MTTWCFIYLLEWLRVFAELSVAFVDKLGWGVPVVFSVDVFRFYLLE